MRRFAIFALPFLAVVFLALPCFAAEKTYHIETLQVTDIVVFDNAYQGFIQGLKSQGIVEGVNLKINKRTIDFDVEKGGIWKKVGVLMEIKSQASQIVTAKPDLVLTIGTPATKYAKDKIIAAGIPLVFTSVAVPEAAGCKSLTVSGPGFTGATLYMNMKNALQITRLAFPAVKTVGIIHTDDDNALAQIQQAKSVGPSLGFNFITKEVGKKDDAGPAAKELIAKGAQAFATTLDTYWGMNDLKHAHELAAVSLQTRIPVFSLINYKSPGAILYVGSDFTYIGSLSGKQAAKILKEGAKPGDLPVLKQEDLSILVDLNMMKALKIDLPMEILQLAKPVK